MVLVEELDDDDNEPIAPLRSAQQATASSSPSGTKSALKSPWKGPDEKEKTKLKAGFLDNAKEPLYPKEGSPEGQVSPDTHKAHQENDMNKKFQKDMNRGAEGNNGYGRPDWYTSDWPKDCQYNSPGCALEEMDSSGHKSELHKGMVRDNARWQEAFTPKATSVRLSFMQLTDEDVAELVKFLKGNTDILELDLTYNHIKDTGVQTLVAGLAGGAAPNLREMRIYRNEYTDLGTTMLTKGLPVLRKKLDIRHEEPEWSRAARVAREEGSSVSSTGGAASAAAAARQQQQQRLAAAAVSSTAGEASTTDSSGMD